jgi:ABC-type lipoprotein release transport system permease subunit
MGVPVIEGRDLSDADTETSERVVVVNETFRKKLMPRTDPIGHQLGDKTRYTIVGIVKDSKYTSVDEAPIPMAYYPYTQMKGLTHLEVELRVSGRAPDMLPSVQRAIHAIDPNLPLENPMTQEAVFERSYSQPRMFSRLSAFFGLLAAFLVAVGLYGTLAYRLARRTSEIGVRMALGARPSRVLWLVLRENLQVTAIGLGFGLVITLISVGLMKSLLYGLQPHDPVTFAAAFIIVILVSLAASFLPARSAAAIPPMQALRVE